MTSVDAGRSSNSNSYVPPPRGGHYENVLLAILFSTFGFVFFDRLALNYLTPYFKDELGLDNSHIGLLGGLPALTWAIAGVTVGYLSDRTDRRKVYLVGAVIVFTAFSALSGFVGGIASLLLLRAVMGGAEGAVLPLAQPLMMYSSSRNRRGLNMGLVQGSSAGLLGGILGPVVTVWMAESFGWRTAFWVTVLPGSVLAVLVLTKVRELRLREAATLAQDAVNSTSPMNSKNGDMTLFQALKTRNIAVCLVIAVFYLTWFTTTQTFTPLYLSEVKEFDGAQASLVLGGIGVAWVIWGALVPGISDRIGRRPAMIGFSSLAVVAPLAVVYIDSAVLLPIVLIATYTGMGCFTLMMATIPGETVPRHLVATCLGIIMGTGEIVGGFFAPWLAGLLSDSFGLQMSMLIPSAAAAVVTALSFALLETAPSKIAASAT